MAWASVGVMVRRGEIWAMALQGRRSGWAERECGRFPGWRVIMSLLRRRFATLSGCRGGSHRCLARSVLLADATARFERR